MRILLIVNEFPPQQLRGTAMATASLAQALARRGWEVQVIVARSDGSPPEEMVGPVRVHRLAIRHVPFTGTVQRLARILALARKIRPDLVQGQAASCGLFAVLVGRWLSIPSITYVQGMDFHEAGRLRRMLEVGPAIRYATKTLAVSDLFATAIRPYTAGPVQSVPHGYQPERIAPEVEATAKGMMGMNGPNLLFVGHLEPDKGETYLLPAVAMLAKDWPGVTLHMVGDGPLSAELEALNEGCPVVVTTACGSAMAVEQGRSGFVVPPADVHALADAMRTILADQGLKEAMRRAAREAGAQYSWDRIVERFERVYATLLRMDR